MTLRYVSFDDVERYLRAGWMVVSPTVPHVVLDSYRVVMVRPCDCEEGGTAGEPFSASW
jgi:hypothetical protein